MAFASTPPWKRSRARRGPLEERGRRGCERKEDGAAEEHGGWPGRRVEIFYSIERDADSDTGRTTAPFLYRSVE